MLMLFHIGYNASLFASFFKSFQRFLKRFLVANNNSGHPVNSHPLHLKQYYTTKVEFTITNAIDNNIAK